MKQTRVAHLQNPHTAENTKSSHSEFKLVPHINLKIHTSEQLLMFLGKAQFLKIQ